MSEYLPSIVIDIGSSSVKACYAGDDDSRILEATVYGKRFNSTYLNHPLQNEYVGSIVYDKINNLNVRPLVKRGVADGYDVEMILDLVSKELDSSASLLLSFPIKKPTSYLMKTIQIAYESYNCQRLLMEPAPYLSLISTNTFNGLVCDIGEGVTQILPVFEGKPYEPAALSFDFGGIDVTQYFGRLMNEEQGYYLSTEKPIDKYVLTEMKNKFSFVSEKDDFPFVETKSFDFENTVYNIQDECYKCSELLFDPLKNYLEFEGIHKMIHSSIKEVIRRDKNVAKLACSNLLMTGGVTLTEGFKKRFEQEFSSIQSEFKTNISFHYSPKTSTVIGGSILAGTENSYIDKSKYNEVGPNIYKEWYI